MCTALQCYYVLRWTNFAHCSRRCHSTFCYVHCSCLHCVQCAMLSLCAQQLILGWDFLSTATAFICCQQCVLHINDTSYLFHADNAPLCFYAEEDTEIPSHSHRIVTLPSDVADSGDVLVQPSVHCVTRGIAFASGLVRLDDTFAFVCASNRTSGKILLQKGLSLACVSPRDPFSVITFQHASPEDSPAERFPFISTLKATISSNLTPLQTQQLLA